MPLHLSTFRTRATSALIFVIIMAVGLLWNQWSFFSLFTLIHFGCWKEYQALMGKIDPSYAMVPMTWNIGFPILGWGGMWLALRGIPPANDALAFTGNIGWGLGIAGLALIIAGTIQRPQIARKNAWYALAGLMYISLPWFLMILLHGFGDNLLSMSQLISGTPDTFHCALILSIWINDTMAYLVGSFIGKTPFSKISPKKTWEGTAGGAVLCVGVMTLIGYYIGIYKMEVWIVIAAIAAIVGTLGDLLESKLKRMAEVKDSGRILPGHGGFLDRFDSLLLATPAVYLYFLLAGL